jgi:hypothetical protein
MQTNFNFPWMLRKYRPVLLEMAVALCLAFLIWLYTHSRGEAVLDNVAIPVDLQLSSGQQNLYDLEIQGPRQVTASFSGASSRIRELRRKLQRGLVKAVIPCSVPEQRLKDGRFSEKIQVEPGHIAVPPGVMTVLTEEGNLLQATFYRIVERQLPVRLEHTPEARVRPLEIEPAMVTVRGPKEVLERARFIPTQPYGFAPSPEGSVEESIVQGQVELVSEMGGKTIQARPETVTFTCRVQPKQKIYELTEVPVLFLSPPGFPWRPRFGPDQTGKISLRIMGPPGEEIPPVHGFVDLTKGNFTRGRNLEPIHVKLPREFQLVPQGPQLISFHLDEIDKGEPALP